MHPGPRIAGQDRVAGDDGLLGRARPTRQAQLRGVGALVGDGPDGETRLLGVLGDQYPEPARVFQRAPHDQRIMHADSVVGEHPDLTGTGGHQPHLGELLAFQAHGDRADRVHVDQADLLPAVPDVVGDHRTVRHRVGVGHREDSGVPT